MAVGTTTSEEGEEDEGEEEEAGEGVGTTDGGKTNPISIQRRRCSNMLNKRLQHSNGLRSRSRGDEQQNETKVAENKPTENKL